jgi:translation initiation factor IF-2
VERVKVPASNWLSRGNEKPQASGGLAAGVVRLSPLEPAAGKVAAVAEEGPALRTMFANHSALLAEQLREALSKKMYGRGPHRVLRIDEPEGPSTAGGKLARQNISLVPRKGSGPSLVCGWVDVSKREAQLRNHDAVAKRYESHHGEPLELVAEEYERFLNDVEEVLAKAVIKVRLIVPEEQAGARMVAPAVQARAKGGVPMVLVLVLMGLAFALGLFVGKTPG